MADNIDPLDQYANAIASIESDGTGGYSALGPQTGGDRAYGKYQVMGTNIPEWTKAALGTELTPSQFLASPEAQDAVFKHRFGSYIQQYGNPQDAASVWFTGKPLAQGANRSDILGTTGSSYVAKFNAALGQPIQSAARQSQPYQPSQFPITGLGASLPQQQQQPQTDPNKMFDSFGQIVPDPEIQRQAMPSLLAPRRKIAAFQYPAFRNYRG